MAYWRVPRIESRVTQEKVNRVRLHKLIRTGARFWVFLYESPRGLIGVGLAVAPKRQLVRSKAGKFICGVLSSNNFSYVSRARRLIAALPEDTLRAVLKGRGVGPYLIDYVRSKINLIEESDDEAAARAVYEERKSKLTPADLTVYLLEHLTQGEPNDKDPGQGSGTSGPGKRTLVRRKRPAEPSEQTVRTDGPVEGKEKARTENRSAAPRRIRRKEVTDADV